MIWVISRDICSSSESFVRQGYDEEKKGIAELTEQSHWSFFIDAFKDTSKKHIMGDIVSGTTMLESLDQGTTQLHFVNSCKKS